MRLEPAAPQSRVKHSTTESLCSHTAIEALLYQILRFMLTFTSNRSMISFGSEHCKYDMHIIYFHASFLDIAFKSIIDDKDITAQSVC